MILLRLILQKRHSNNAVKKGFMREGGETRHALWFNSLITGSIFSGGPVRHPGALCSLLRD